MKRLIAMVLTIATLLTPSDVYAKETVKIEPPHDKSQVVTYDEVFSKISNIPVDALLWGEVHYYKNNGVSYSDEVFDGHGDMRQYFESLNGCYDDKGLKIYTVFDGKTKKFKKTGTWSIIVGSNKKKLDYGCVKFTAPKDGYYKFTIDVRKNVLRGPVNYSIEWNHCADKKYKVKSPKLHGVADKVADRGCEMYYGTYDCPASPRKESFYTNMKKGQSVEYEAGSTYNSYVNNYNYKREYYADCYVGFDFTVERVSGWKK